MSQAKINLRSAMFEAKKTLCDVDVSDDYICFPGNSKRSGLFVEYNKRQKSGSDYQCAVFVLAFAIAYDIPCVVYTRLKDDFVIYKSIPDEVLQIYACCPEVFHISAKLTMSYRLSSVGCPVRSQPGKLYYILAQSAVDSIANHRDLFEQKTVCQDPDYFLCQNTFAKYVSKNLNVPTLSIKIHRNVFRKDQKYILEVMSILLDLINNGELILNEEYN